MRMAPVLCYLIIDGVFKSNQEQIDEYEKELRKCLAQDMNKGMLWFGINYPILFILIVIFVVLDLVVIMNYAPDGEGMYLRPPTQSLFLWGQSLFLIAKLLTAGLLHINELDPIKRYLPSYNRPRKGGRYSAFQVTYYFFI